jgi:MFS family permease
MTAQSRVISFINIGHLVDHLVMLIFPTAVLGMQADFDRSYSELIALAVGGFVMFGAGSLPAGWLGDRWSRRHMMAVFFLGLGAATIATGFALTYWQLALGLAAIGLFAAIYHPVGTAMLVTHTNRLGHAIGSMASGAISGSRLPRSQPVRLPSGLAGAGPSSCQGRLRSAWEQPTSRWCRPKQTNKVRTERRHGEQVSRAS